VEAGAVRVRDTGPAMLQQANAKTTSALELTRRAFASANGGDYDAMMVFFGPDSFWDASRWGLGLHAGRTAVRNFFKDWIGAFDTWVADVEEMHDIGNGVVSTVAVQTGETARGGRIVLQYAAVFVWADGVATQVILYRDLDEARADAQRLAEEQG
jgi:ketosteroid isomerase-like protein